MQSERRHQAQAGQELTKKHSPSAYRTFDFWMRVWYNKGKKGGGNVGDIFKLYLKNRKNAVTDKSAKTVIFDNEGLTYRVIITKKRASKLSLIHCVNDAVVWEQIPFLYLRNNERGRGDIIDNIPITIDKNFVTFFVIKGRPRSICGLDEGIFRSAKNLDFSYINIMSEKKFREL